MAKITTDQSHQVIATLIANANWGSIDFVESGLQDLIIRNPKEAGRQFTTFLKNGGRIIGEHITFAIRHVKVDRSRTPLEIIDATKCQKWYIDDHVLAEMPTNGRKEENVEFFELCYNPTVKQLDIEYEVRGLKPDPAAVAQVMIEDPYFAHKRSIVVQWRNSEGLACSIIFFYDSGERKVSVSWGGRGWNQTDFFAGVRK